MMIESTPDPFIQCRRAALTYLARRDHSQWELTQKLRRKGNPAHIIEMVIEALKEKRFLNDTRFAKGYCHYRRTRGYGPLCIIAELQARGVEAETIAEVVEITDNEWFIVALNLRRKRFKSKPADDFTRRAKQMRFLQHRGFTREQIDNAFDNDR